MSKSGSSGVPAGAPTAPPSDVINPSHANMQPRAPPPSYEESMRMHNAGAVPPPYYPAGAPQPYPPNYGVSYGTNYALPQHNPNQFTSFPPAMYQPSVSSQANNNMGKPVLEFNKRATVRTANGSVASVPPPPPGVLPTPAQLAAMNGQPVMIQKQKRGFFKNL